MEAVPLYIPGCSIEDCLKQFFATERLENYFCTHCWHTSAIKYLSLLNKNETDIEKVQNCSNQDTCECKNIQSLISLPWSNNYSRTFKQLHIARSPKILCLNLQRASVTAYGESVKLQGHIRFPLTLDMSPFQNRGAEIKHSEQNKPSISYSHIFRLQNDSCNVHTQEKENNLSEVEEIEEVHETLEMRPMRHYIYNLVSVVEHFGDTGSGHYTVYRRVGEKKRNGIESEAIMDGCDVYYWVGVSDSHVCRVSEDDVLGARASLLFYERI
ncbi:hypothetical protein LXL04_014151 [Taraxacum kok-saghyz]